MEKQTDYYALAMMLKKQGMPFEEAYELIFGRPPRMLQSDYVRAAEELRDVMKNVL